jgi:bifunctional DNA-binding transcriptional regulator/antitoxin component of YhaV-PrlF toxin-antitoxin module
MSDTERPKGETIGEGAVSGNQASIPSPIRERADIEDGDKIRWYWRGGELSVEVIRRRSGVFDDFDGFESQRASVDYDAAGLDPAGELDASDLDGNAATEE